MDISIHAPTNGATQIGARFEQEFVISIHAPTNGATVGVLPFVIYKEISIHAPTNGATRLWSSTMSRAEHFNPRSDERSDSDLLTALYSINISIHAPTNGATKLKE